MADEKDTHIKPFAAFLQTLQRGSVHEELSEGLHQLVEKVDEIGKGGSISLTIKVKPDPKTGMLIVADDVKLVLPEWDRQQSMWFKDQTGNLTRNDPNQIAFDGMKSVEDSDNTPKSIQGEAQEA
ncbi:hypothetical protein [Williamsia sp.]|uniref:hypothetical protein n=1 Tax=Williamsia sp. TaxID=1872085 RepID=UPI002F924770